MRHKYNPIGQFEMTGGAMRVSDPRFSDVEGYLPSRHLGRCCGPQLS